MVGFGGGLMILGEMEKTMSRVFLSFTLGASIQCWLIINKRSILQWVVAPITYLMTSIG